MLAIRMQRTGRSGHAQFRVIVQDSHFSPTRGRVVSYLGNYNPHTKTATIDSQKAAEYLKNGARPSDTVARLFKKEGIKLPAWVQLDSPKKREVRNPEKRRSTAPAQPETSAEPEAPVEPVAEAEAITEEAPAETDTSSDVAQETAEAPTEETTETPVEEAAAPEAPTEKTQTPEEPSQPSEEPTETPAEAEK